MSTYTETCSNIAKQAVAKKWTDDQLKNYLSSKIGLKGNDLDFALEVIKGEITKLNG